MKWILFLLVLFLSEIWLGLSLIGTESISDKTHVTYVYFTPTVSTYVPGVTWTNPVATPTEKVIDWANDPQCLKRADRNIFKPYALNAGFSEGDLPKLLEIINERSGGDLCYVDSDGNTCWFALPYGRRMLDPVQCMGTFHAIWVRNGSVF